MNLENSITCYWTYYGDRGIMHWRRFTESWSLCGRDNSDWDDNGFTYLKVIGLEVCEECREARKRVELLERLGE